MKHYILFVLLCCALASCTKEVGDDSIPPRKKSGAVCGFEDRYADEENKVAADRFESYQAKKNQYITPTEKVPLEDWPVLVDDLSFSFMQTAIERQLARYSEINLNGRIRLGNENYPLAWAEKSLIVFRELIHQFSSCRTKNKNDICQSLFESQIRQRFHLYKPQLTNEDPRFGEEKSVLFTGYYTPTLKVRRQPSAEYPYGVYRIPVEEDLRLTSRVGIDFRRHLVGKDLEIFYASDLFDLYLLHVQGGGHVVFEEDGKSREQYLSYAGTNGQSWNFISKYMQEKKMIHDSSIYSQRMFLDSNPHLQEEIYSSCPSYVYFKSSVHPPEGSDRVPLTDNRSIATDTRYYRFKGLLAFVSAERPVEGQSLEANCGEVEFQPFTRFYLDQDTGGAIRGKGRVDLYFGEGEYAEMAAYNLVKTGQLYFLMLKR